MKRSILAVLAVVALTFTWQATRASDRVATNGPLNRSERTPPPSPHAPWRLVEERWDAVNVSPSGRLLVVQARGGPCGRQSRATATETPSTVELRVQQLVPADLSAIRCRAPAVETLLVRLSTPIGERALVHHHSTSAGSGL